MPTATCTAKAATSTKLPSSRPVARPRQYWLFKSEPDVFSIDDLATAPDQTTRWDGIRNYQARNLLRDQVKPGDGVFFYHSSCKTPGIAGTAEVCSQAYPDPLQFDPESPYFDGKSDPDSPRWFSVDLRLQTRFTDLIPVKTLKSEQALTDMVLFRQGRLSIQPVTEEQWQFIIDVLARR